MGHQNTPPLFFTQERGRIPLQEMHPGIPLGTPSIVLRNDKTIFIPSTKKTSLEKNKSIWMFIILLCFYLLILYKLGSFSFRR